MRSDVPPAYGYLDVCREDEGRLVLEGWLLLRDGRFEELQTILPQGETLPVQRFHRSDLGAAFPQVPGSSEGGFRVEIPLPELARGETFDVQIVGLRSGRPIGCMNVSYHRSDLQQEYPPGDVMKRAVRLSSQSFWRATGIKACNDLRRALRPHIDLGKVGRMLDWGCSSGRVAHHLIDVLPHVEVHGTDIDVEAVEWASRHLRGRFVPCGRDPPLPYESCFFDLVICLSVFTHLTKAYQELWLAEIHRVVKPGGTFLATANGEFTARWEFWQPGVYEKLMRSGFNEDLTDHTLEPVASGDYYRGTIQSYEWTRALWGQYFDVVDFIEGGINNIQDVYIMRRPG